MNTREAVSPSPVTPPAVNDSVGTPSEVPPVTEHWLLQPRGLLIAAVLLVLGHGPLLAEFAANLWEREHYQFFPLAIAGALFLTCQNYPGMAVLRERRYSTCGWILFAAGLALLTGSIVLWSPWLGAVACLVNLTGLACAAGGVRLLRAIFPALLMLAIIIPPPFNYDAVITLKLRAFAVKWSSALLDLAGVTHSVLGNTIEVSGQRLLVDEACSGINSVLSVTAFSLFVALWRRRSVAHVCVALVGGLGFVMLGNVVRIGLGAWLRAEHGIDILSPRAHEISGLVMFTLYVVLVLSLDQLLWFFFSPVPRRRSMSSESESKPGSAAEPAFGLGLRDWRMPYGAITCALVAVLGLGVFQGVKRINRPPRESSSWTQLPTSLRGTKPFKLPERVGNFSRIEAKDQHVGRVELFGQYSQHWVYQFDRGLVFVAIDYPFPNFHDLVVCYRNQGWMVLNETVRNDPGPAGKFLEVQLTRVPLRAGFLWFSLIDLEGRWLDAPQMSPVKGRLVVEPHGDIPAFQIQTFVQTYAPLRSEEIAQIRQLYVELRRLLVEQILGQAKSLQP